MTLRKDRLLKLASFLETVPRKRFNLEQWQTEPPTRQEGKKEGSCGFAGCAVGWATHAKLFRGLRLSDAPIPQLKYAGVEAWVAVRLLFGFKQEDDDVKYLFSSEEYVNNPTPKQVAKRIRTFVAEH